jgi:pilus assembly protein CpaE
VRVAPGFGVLSGADDDPSQAAEVKPEHIDTILRVARQHYDDILLDLGRQIDAVSLRALDVADAIHPVLQMTLPDLRDARRLLDMFGALGYDAARVRLLVNRYDKSGRLRLADLRDALGTDAFHTIPNDYAAVADSVNQGVPLLRLARGSAAARSLADLADLLTARRAPEPKRLFDRLFGARATIDQ